MKKLFFCLCLFFPFLTLFSQSNFKEGYIISSEKDTVRGLIDFRSNQSNSVICRFKQSENVPEKIFHPGEIAGFMYLNEGKYYVTRTVEIDKVIRIVFLEFLVQGLLNLYYFPEGLGYYFFETKDGNMISTTVKADEKLETSFKIDTRFRGILYYVFKDDIKLSKQTSTAAFSRKTMIDFTKTYHDHMCTSGDRCIIFENDYTKKYTKINMTAYSGFEWNSIHLDYRSFTEMNSFSPVIGGELNVCFPRILKSLNVKIDVDLAKIDGECHFLSGYNVQSQYKFSGLKSDFSGGFQYVYDKGNFRPSFYFGISYCYLYNLKSTLKNEYVNYLNDFVTTINENVMLPRDLSFGIKTGIGVDYKINNDHFIVLNLLYSNHNNPTDKLNTYQLKLGYKF